MKTRCAQVVTCAASLPSGGCRAIVYHLHLPHSQSPPSSTKASSQSRVAPLRAFACTDLMFDRTRSTLTAANRPTRLQNPDHAAMQTIVLNPTKYLEPSKQKRSGTLGAVGVRMSSQAPQSRSPNLEIASLKHWRILLGVSIETELHLFSSHRHVSKKIHGHG